MSDIEMAYDAIRAKRNPMALLFDYYDGLQPLKYSLRKLQDVFGKSDVYFAQNWCSVVVDSLVDRMIFGGWDSGDEAKNAALDMFFDVAQVALDSRDVHLSLSITGEAFYMVDTDDSGVGGGYYNDPRVCHMFYKDDKPKEILFGVKVFMGEDGKPRMNLYYPDEIQHWVSTVEKPDSGKSFTLESSEQYSYSHIPLFHFAVNRRKTVGDLTAGILSNQDAINLFNSDSIIASNFSSMIQRVIMTNAAVGQLPNEAGVNWVIPDVEAKAIELGGRADALQSYMNAIDKQANSIAIQSKIPKHYFFEGGGNLSGDALIAIEAPLTKKTQARIDSVNPVWIEAGQLILEMLGYPDNQDIVTTWRPVEIVQPEATARIRKTNVETGIPVATSLRWEGKTESEVQAVLEDIETQRIMNSTLADEALARVRALDNARNANGETQINA